MRSEKTALVLAVVITVLRGMVWFVFALLVTWLCLRVAKLLGHWEYGVLLFMVVGYLANISISLSQILQRVSRKY